MNPLSELLEGIQKDSCCYKAITEAYFALFEDVASTATHRTKRVIREMFPEMAGMWDSVAVDDRGNPILTMSHKQQTFIELFEREIRNNFFHSGANQKFEPGVARIAYGELHMNNSGHDAGKLESLKKIVKMISDAHASEYDADLNGLSYSDLNTRFGATVQTADEELKKELKETKYTPSDYIIEEIPDFETAQKFYEYTYPDSRWCLTYLESQWKAYTSKGINKVYFAYKPNFKEVKPNYYDMNAPLDEYGLSLISIIVTPFGHLRAVTTRWNHENGGSDEAMNAKELSQLLGGNVFELCPPPGIPEQHIDRVDDDSVRIGDQIWMCHNLHMPDDCKHGIYTEYGETYFTWEAAMRVGNEYGNGWRLPTAEDWRKLFAYVSDDESNVGVQLKSTRGWYDDDGVEDHGENGFDTYGFNLTPAGYINLDSNKISDKYNLAMLWTSTKTKWNFDSAYCIQIDNYAASDNEYRSTDRYAFPIRLVKDT